MRAALHDLREKRVQLESQKGADFRARQGLLDVPAQTERASTFDVPLAVLDRQINALRIARRAARQALRSAENTAEVKGNLPEPAASLSLSKVSDVEAPEGAFQLKSK